MKCPNCGAEVKRGQTVCPYCDSEVEILRKDASSAGNEAAAKRRTDAILAIIKAFVIITVVLILSGALLVFGTLAFLEHSGQLDGSGSAGGGIKGQSNINAIVLSDNGNGEISLQYNGSDYENVKILDEELTNWLKETGRSLEGTEILFSTNEKGDIREIAMSSEPFMILAEEEGVYTACRGQQIVRFTSKVPLQRNTIYEGYFSYPNLELVSCDLAKNSVGVSMYYDEVCGGKQSVEEKEAYTGEEVTLYQLYRDGKWYYCDQTVYDTIHEGDSLLDYSFYDLPLCVTADYNIAAMPPDSAQADGDPETPEEEEDLTLYYDLDGEAYEVVEILTDRVGYRDFADLEQNADYVVKGTFTEDAVEKGDTSVNTFQVDQVLKGTISGNTIQIAQRYEVKKNTKSIIAYSKLTPMEKGSEWIYFLTYDEEKDWYWVVGDTYGRYPNALIEQDQWEQGACLPKELGVYRTDVFRYDIYADMLAAYGLFQ